MEPDLEANIEISASNENCPPVQQKKPSKDKANRTPWGKREAELYRPGYPLYASFLDRHYEFHNFRRFRTLRMRMLLLKQDRISKLEEELNRVDREEVSELFLGSCRRDKNTARKDVMTQLDQAFSDYDDLLQRSHWAIHMESSIPRHVDTVENWLKEKGCIARPEIRYLRAEPYDLLNIGKVKDQGMSKVAHLVEHIAVFFARAIRKILPKKSSDQRDAIVIYNPFIRAAARALAAIIAITLLLVPIIALNAVQQTVARFVILFAATTCFVTVVTVASKATMAEIFAAGAAYSAVLVVFVSSNGLQSQTQS